MILFVTSGWNMVAAFNLQRTLGLVVLGAVLLFAFVFGVFFPAAMFVVAIWEKRSERPLKPAGEASMAKVTPASRAIVDAAIARRFSLLGTFSDGDAGWKEGVVTLLLSGDGLVLVKRVHSKLAGRYQLITRFAGDRWVVTCDNSGTADLSGLNAQTMLHKANFAGLLLYHQQRVAAVAGETPVPFDPNSVVQDLWAHEMHRHEVMAAAGLERAIAGRDNTWVYRPRGAMKLAAGFYRDIFNGMGQGELGEAKNSEAAAMEEFQAARPLPPVESPRPLPPIAPPNY